MSHPTSSSTSNSNSNKRSSSPYSAAPSAAAAAQILPAMKKAKSQPLDGNKSGQQCNTPHVHFSDPPALSPMIEDDPNDAVLEASSPSSAFGRSATASGGGVTANLSRKKATPPQPTKKLVIKLNKAKPTLPVDFEENTWATLKSAISAIFLKQPNPCDLEKLYQAVNDLCLHKMGGSLYRRIEKECETYISEALQSLVGQSEDLVVFLSLVQKRWQDFCDQMLMIRGVALYLDRTYVKQTPNVRSLWDMGLQLFHKHLSLASEVERKTVFGILPDPDPAAVQTQTLHQPASATIPAFPEQSEDSGCPLDLPNDLFHDIKSACGAKLHHRSDPSSYSGQLHRSRCCPVLAAWLYSAYSKTALRPTAKSPPEATSYEMPVLPDDSETCVDTLEKALSSRGIELGRPNETCDVVYCHCGIRLHPFSCSEAFRVNSRRELVGGAAVEKLERDCFSGGVAGGGCSKCLNTLYSLNGRRGNTTERTSKMHKQDCQLMGLTWLLNKNRSAYIHTVSAVLRALMTNTDDPTYCSLNSDGMPLAVDSSEINDQSSSISLHHHYLLTLCLVCTSILFLIIPC